MAQAMIDKYPAADVTIKLAVSVGAGMVIGFEREWSHEDAGTRTFALTAILGMSSPPLVQRVVKSGRWRCVSGC